MSFNAELLSYGGRLSLLDTMYSLKGAETEKYVTTYTVSETVRLNTIVVNLT